MSIELFCAHRRAVSSILPKASERGSSLIGKMSHCRGFCETQGIVVAVRSKKQGFSCIAGFHMTSLKFKLQNY